MRDLWGQARASYNAPTRRKKERAKSFVLKDPDGIKEDLTVLAQHYPAPMIFYFMPEAGLLAGKDRLDDRSREWMLKAIVDEVRIKEFENKHPGRLTSSFKNVPRSYGRMLAKIGHCQVMTVLDWGDFEPICLPYVLGKRSNVSYVVGSSSIIAPPQPEFGYFLRTIQISSNDRMLLVVEVRLLANNATPTYHVVVGEVIGSENIERIGKKLHAMRPIEKVERINSTSAIHNGYSWTPQVWPVKY